MHQAARALREDDLELTGVAEPGPARKPRRTITITGRPDPAPPQALGTAPRAARLVQIRRRRPGPHPIERMSAPPDRLAMWALMMAIVLIVVAALSSHS